MSLIEEIEARSYLDVDGDPANMLECMLVNSAYWPRIAELERENKVIRALMNGYNLGGWTAAIPLMQRALEAERERDALRADVQNRNLKAELFSLCVSKGLLRVRSERMINIDPNTRCSWIEHGERSAMDLPNDAYDAVREGK